MESEPLSSPDGLPICICRVDTPEGKKDLVTCLSHDLVFRRGLPKEAIIGILQRPLEPGERITPGIFAHNRFFVDFMHEIIARSGPELTGLIAEARRQGKGWVYIIDQRTRNPRVNIPPQDVIGAFAVENGQVVPNSYQHNPNHMILSADGFVHLGNELQTCLLTELAKRANSST
jgi:hypothetical protein